MCVESTKYSPFNPSTYCFWNYFFDFWALSFGKFSCWKMNRHPSLMSKFHSMRGVRQIIGRACVSLDRMFEVQAQISLLFFFVCFFLLQQSSVLLLVWQSPKCVSAKFKWATMAICPLYHKGLWSTQWLSVGKQKNWTSG